uniref:Hexosyltransferase n=2 Tax=Haemonchus contortus TaxID=6289 RepID=A0A7I4Y4H9_HAECO
MKCENSRSVLVRLGLFLSIMVLVCISIDSEFVGRLQGGLVPSFATSKAGLVENANRLVWKRFGENIDFLDERLRVINYTIVPAPSSYCYKHFVVVVASRTNDSTRRTRLRNTYGRFGNEMPGTESDEQAIEQEAKDHGDILQAKFVDSYRNLTIKNISAMRYVASVCTEVKAVLKVDDDVAWNVLETSLLVNSAAANGSIHCPQIQKPPVRDPNSTWYISEEEFPGEMYPPYCCGFAYLIPVPALQTILNATKTERLIHMEDVFITGQLAQKSGVNHVNIMDRVSFYRDDHRWFSEAIFTLVPDSQAIDFFVLSNAKWFLQRFLPGTINS